MSCRLALGLERGLHHLFEHRDGQPRPPLGQGSVSNGLAGELFHMLGQCARLRHHMEDQALNQLPRTDHGRTATTHATTAQQAVKERTWNQLSEQSPEGSHWDDSTVSHPQLNGILETKVQA